MKLKALGLLLPLTAAVACSAPSVNSQADADRKAPVTPMIDGYDIGNGYRVALNNGSAYNISFGGTVKKEGLSTKATALTSSTVTYNANGFLVVLTPKLTAQTFAAAQKVWLLAKGSAGSVLKKSAGATTPPEVTDASNYGSLRAGTKQLAVSMPANMPAGVYAVVVDAADEGAATAAASAGSAATLTITDTNTGNTSWYNPVWNGTAFSEAATLM